MQKNNLGMFRVRVKFLPEGYGPSRRIVQSKTFSLKLFLKQTQGAKLFRKLPN